MSEPWDKQRDQIYAALEKLGNTSLREWASMHEGSSFTALAKALDEDIMPIRIAQHLRAEALAAGKPAEFLRDSLVRCLRELMPLGWGVGQSADFDRANAYSDWFALVGKGLQESAEIAWQRLKGIPPPMGWLPRDSKDCLIDQALRAE